MESLFGELNVGFAAGIHGLMLCGAQGHSLYEPTAWQTGGSMSSTQFDRTQQILNFGLNSNKKTRSLLGGSKNQPSLVNSDEILQEILCAVEAKAIFMHRIVELFESGHRHRPFHKCHGEVFLAREGVHSTESWPAALLCQANEEHDKRLPAGWQHLNLYLVCHGRGQAVWRGQGRQAMTLSTARFNSHATDAPKCVYMVQKWFLPIVAGPSF